MVSIFTSIEIQRQSTAVPIHGKAFDQRLMTELSRFGQHYADIGALVYRQAGHKKR